MVLIIITPQPNCPRTGARGVIDAETKEIVVQSRGPLLGAFHRKQESEKPAVAEPHRYGRKRNRSTKASSGVRRRERRTSVPLQVGQCRVRFILFSALAVALAIWREDHAV